MVDVNRVPRATWVRLNRPLACGFPFRSRNRAARISWCTCASRVLYDAFVLTCFLHLTLNIRSGIVPWRHRNNTTTTTITIAPSVTTWLCPLDPSPCNGVHLRPTRQNHQAHSQKGFVATTSTHPLVRLSSFPPYPPTPNLLSHLCSSRTAASAAPPYGYPT